MSLVGILPMSVTWLHIARSSMYLWHHSILSVVSESYGEPGVLIFFALIEHSDQSNVG